MSVLSSATSRVALVLRTTLLGIVYFALAAVSITLATRHGSVAFIWPPGAVLLAVLLRSPPDRWLLYAAACFVADVLANVMLGQPLGLGLGLALASMAEVLPGAWLIRRFFGLPFRLATLRETLGFLLWAGLLAPVLGALIGATALSLGPDVPFAAAFQTWWTSTALAMIVVAPVILTWTSGFGARLLRPKTALEALALFLAAGWVTSYAFTQPLSPLLFLLLPLLLWAALRFGPPGHSLTALLVTTLALIRTYEGVGPIAATAASAVAQSHLLQLFLAAVSLPSLLIAVIIEELRRRAAERERLIDTLESQKAELERFAYTISHELKTPLFSISGFAGMVRQDLSQGDLERAHADLGVIEQAIQTMKQSLDHLLDLTRAGKVMGPKQPIALRTLVSEALENLSGTPENAGVQVAIHDTLPVVSGDAQRLREVLTILLDNAFKFTRNRPEPCISVGFRDEAPHPVIFVRDNGIGIDPAYHERVFDLFERLDHREGGVGAGLPLARRIIEAHGGHMWIESEGEGHGTTVCFRLPGETSGK